MNLHWHELGCSRRWLAGEVLSDLMINSLQCRKVTSPQKTLNTSTPQKAKGRKHPSVAKILFPDDYKIRLLFS